MDVLLTGANGTVGTAITDHLGEQYDFARLDVEPGDRTDLIADVRKYDDVRPHFDGRDAVVHLALTPGTGGPEDRSLAWSQPQSDNLEGIHNVYEAAVDAGLDSIVFASSNHAVGMVEMRNRPEVYHDSGVRAGHDEPHRPDSRYGLTKAYGEDLGRLAAEAHDVRFYALRIGSVRDPEYDHPYGDAERGVEEGRWERGSDDYEEQVARLKGLWQSRRDLAHMVECCLEDESVEWDHFYGVSGNERRWLDDLEHARETIGYEPRDAGEEWDGPPA
ncbi:NAD-dependent epimerase/dehydratase family protein [Haloarcula nitratireducens]|uniref:NAD(P)-dependent oxidoreductase n=1 Tax=Haloarcula nitratireducens TaxID=2487749 RepID=A0AAW4PAZ6_9EURY|nr:NAD(P)-dependent oxidoreductase [Halomicroarcula nitratireducens]MBX0295039.1 NAD(P)-dependent oxidoreductase [Halomicroarcula nitratireducens]